MRTHLLVSVSNARRRMARSASVTQFKSRWMLARIRETSSWCWLSSFTIFLPEPRGPAAGLVV